MAKLFISYRREDSQHQADRLHAALRPYLANPREDVFIDIDNIPFGIDFISHLNSKVSECEVVLALIGHNWLDATNPQTGLRRIDDPNDFVRLEIASALKLGILVVPVLLDGAPVPSENQLPDDLKPLARRNGVPIQRLTFDADVARLVHGLPVKLKQKSNKESQSDRSLPAIMARTRWIVFALILLLAATGVTFYLVSKGPGHAKSDANGREATPSMSATAEEVEEAKTLDSEEPLAEAVEIAVEPSTAISSKPEDQGETASSPIKISDPRKDAIKDLQTALWTLGIYHSSKDGDAGPITRLAVQEFVSQNGGSVPDLDEAPISEIAALTKRVKQEAKLWGLDSVKENSSLSAESFVALREMSDALGAAHYIRTLCNGDSDSYWRDSMNDFLAYFSPNVGPVRAAFVEAFNKGYRARASGAESCTDDAIRLEAQIARSARAELLKLNKQELNNSQAQFLRGLQDSFMAVESRGVE